MSEPELSDIERQILHYAPKYIGLVCALQKQVLGEPWDTVPSPDAPMLFAVHLMTQERASMMLSALMVRGVPLD